MRGTIFAVDTYRQGLSVLAEFQPGGRPYFLSAYPISKGSGRRMICLKNCRAERNIRPRYLSGLFFWQETTGNFDLIPSLL
jgi:hypothetical protein